MLRGTGGSPAPGAGSKVASSRTSKSPSSDTRIERTSIFLVSQQKMCQRNFSCSPVSVRTTANQPFETPSTRHSSVLASKKGLPPVSRKSRESAARAPCFPAS